MKRIRLSTLLLLVAIAALALGLMIQGRELAEVRRRVSELEAANPYPFVWSRPVPASQGSGAGG